MARILTTKMLLMKVVAASAHSICQMIIYQPNSKAVRAVEGGEADSDDSVDNQSNRLDTLGNDNVVAGGETDTFKEIPKKGLNKAEEAEYAKIMDELPKLEHLVKGLDVMISQVATDYEKMQSLMEEREETQTQIDVLTERWMELEERL